MVHVYGITRVIHCSSFTFNRLSLPCLDHSGKGHLAWHEFQAIKIDLYKRIWKGGPRVVWGCVKVDICEVETLHCLCNWRSVLIERERRGLLTKATAIVLKCDIHKQRERKKVTPWLQIRWASCNYGCTRCATSADGSRHWLGWPLPMMMTQMNGPQWTSIYYKDDVSWESL